MCEPVVETIVTSVLSTRLSRLQLGTSPTMDAVMDTLTTLYAEQPALTLMGGALIAAYGAVKIVKKSEKSAGSKRKRTAPASPVPAKRTRPTRSAAKKPAAVRDPQPPGRRRGARARRRRDRGARKVERVGRFALRGRATPDPVTIVARVSGQGEEDAREEAGREEAGASRPRPRARGRAREALGRNRSRVRERPSRDAGGQVSQEVRQEGDAEVVRQEGDAALDARQVDSLAPRVAGTKSRSR